MKATTAAETMASKGWVDECVDSDWLANIWGVSWASNVCKIVVKISIKQKIINTVKPVFSGYTLEMHYCLLNVECLRLIKVTWI